MEQQNQRRTPQQSPQNENRYNSSLVIGFIFIFMGIILFFLKGTGMGAVGGVFFSFLFFLIGIIFWVVGMAGEKK